MRAASMRVMLAQITAPHFCAGLGVDVERKTIVDAAPIIRYMVGWTANHVADYCYSKGWDVRRVECGVEQR